MKIRLVAIALLLATVLGAPVLAQQQRPSADTVVIHARIYTVNLRQPWAEAVAIRDGKIIAVSSDKAIAPYRGASTKIIDAKGRMVLPGFFEGHVHILGGAKTLDELDLSGWWSGGPRTPADFQKMIKDYAAQHPDDKWITGMGWTYNIFGKGGLPNKKLIDEVVPDRPVFLPAYDGHTAIANSAALRIAGITRDTPNPANGIIDRDPKTGEATGVLKEAPAQQLVEKFIPTMTRDEELVLLAKAFQYLNSVGLTSLTSCGGDVENIDLFAELRKRGQLTARFYGAPIENAPGTAPQFSQFMKRVEDLRDKYHDDWIDVAAVKFFADGVIESHTAAMLQTYANASTRGNLNFDPAVYTNDVVEVNRRGFQVFTHAIGDRGIRMALDAYQEAEKVTGNKDLRDSVEHIEDPSAADIPRFGKLGVVASMQPLHEVPNYDILHVWAVNVGPERAQRAWPWHDILAGGAHLAAGSDWPVVTPDPWKGIQEFLTRETPEGTPSGGWHPNERITLPEAIKAYTLDGAYRDRREKILGSIQPGKLADMIMISQNLFQVAPMQIANTKVLMTMVGGKVVYEAPAETGEPAGAN
ncbi:MAG TPA: amidohydrolase [Candidatus Acidoferrales bacterium]